MSLNAVVELGGRQYLVKEGQQIEVNKLEIAEGAKTFESPAIMLYSDDAKTFKIGETKIPTVAKVEFDLVSDDTKGDKVIAIRFKAKKRVHKRRGHRQRLTTLKVTSIK
jgi:large subunit ribosomal protein L21